MLAIRLPSEIEGRLEALAARTGRTKTFYAREAILHYLDDLEGAYLKDQVSDRLNKSTKTSPADRSPDSKR